MVTVSNPAFSKEQTTVERDGQYNLELREALDDSMPMQHRKTEEIQHSGNDKHWYGGTTAEILGEFSEEKA